MTPQATVPRFVARVGVVGLALALCLGAGQAGSASGESTLLRAVAPATWPPDGGTFEVRVEVDGVTNLAAFRWNLAFDPAVLAFESVEAGAFLGSTGRSVSCSGGDFFTPQYDIFSFECLTSGTELPGPTGAGVLARARFHPIGRGPSPFTLTRVKLSDPLGLDIPVVIQQSSVTVGRSADTPVPTATPVGRDGWPAGPAATPTPIGPKPTDTPLPGREALSLARGCNPVAGFFPRHAPIESVAGSVEPTGILEAVWQFGEGLWLGYSPEFPDVSDLMEVRSDVIFVCVAGPGELAPSAA